MAAIKSVARSSSVAFGPTEPTLLALATQDGALDASFSASASLELFKIDFASSDSELELLGSRSSSEKFNSIAWGTAGAGSEEQAYGLIATGQSDGTVSLWNPATLTRKDSDTESTLVSKSQKHGGRVRGLEFNGITPNLLASGGDDGEVIIWDVVNPNAPSHFPALKGTGQENIVDLSWNRKVQHIMATTSNTGVSMVWDLRRQKSILSFTDPNNRRPCAALEWNPEGATQLVVASADDRSPSLQIWDLRNSISPVKELIGHTKGLVAMAWCPIDSALLLSSAKDYRTVCWDTFQGEIVCELPLSSNWNFDLQWSPRIAGVLSTSSYDGRVNLYNIEACSRILPSEGAFGGATVAGFSPAMRAPKWLKRTAGVTFGFDGKFVTFGTNKGASVSELSVQTLILEDDLVARSKEFEASVADSDNKSSLQALCDKKAEDSRSEEETEIWSFLRIMFEEQARASLLCHLGYVPPQLEERKREETANGAEPLHSENADNLNVSNGKVEIAGGNLGFLDASVLDSQREYVDDGADFFNNLATPKGAISPQLQPQVHEEAAAENLVLYEGEHEGEVIDDHAHEQSLPHALVVADFKDAVRQYLSEDRLADALILAHAGGRELWEETLAAYFKKHHRPDQKVFAAIVANNFGNLVNSRPLSTWRETLALLCSYAGSPEWTLLCDGLAKRLDAAGLTHAARLCYICAGNTEELARLWYRDVLLMTSSVAFAKELHDLMEKIVVLALAKGEKRVTRALSRLVGSYADLLASQGVVTAALNYLALVPPEESPEDLMFLRDRISRVIQVEAQAGNYASGDSVQGVLPVPTATAPVAVQAPLDNAFGSYNAQQLSSREAAPSTMYYSGSGGISEQVPAPGYPQPGIFLPTPPDRSQLSNIYQPLSGPTPIDHPSAGAGFIPPATNQFMPGVVNASHQPSEGIREWPRDPYGFQKSFEPIPSPTPAPAMMFPGPTSMSTPPMRGFIPVPAPRAPMTQLQPGPVTSGMQPQSPVTMSPPRAQPTPAFATPVTIQTVDTANVPGDLKPVVATLTRLYHETAEVLGGVRATHTKKREIDDNSKKLGGLFERLNKSDISPNARAKLIQICQCIDTGDFAIASQLQVSLTTSDWDECGSWLGSLKRMMKLRQSLR